MPAHELAQDMKEGIGISEPIKRLDRREDRWAPRYLAMAQPLAKYGEFGPSLIAKISDFGACKSLTNLCTGQSRLKLS